MAWKPDTVDSVDMAVHAALVPGGANGRVLFFGGYLVDDTHLYDVDGGALMPMAPTGVPGYNAFCSGHAFLADGRVLVAGGQRQARDEYGEVMGCDAEPEQTDHPHGGMTWGGERRCALFLPLAGSWSPAADLNLDPAKNPHSGGRWYPTLTTLPDGDVLAVGGHPFLCEDYPSADNRRHSNSAPERYNPGSDSWTLLASNPPALNQLTAEDGVADYDYQRNHLLPNGRVFFASRVRGKNRFYRPDQAAFLENPVVDLPPEDTYQDRNFARFASVLLPLLHQDGYRPRVLVANGQRPYRIDLGAQTLGWETAGDRAWPDDEFPDGIGPRRYFACPVMLPTGEIFFSGGTRSDGSDEVRQNNAVKQAELYDPDIDWNAGYDGPGSWQTLEAAAVARHYHSTALLLPDGSVWTAGSNGPSDDPAHPGGDERRIEIYEPWYFAQQEDRPDISNVPASIGYGYTFRFNYTLATGAGVSRVVFVRSGSVTHAFNPDQRLVSVSFKPVGGTTLEITVPFTPEVLPPGRYLLWLVDDQHRPCKEAAFIRISKQKALFSVDFDKFAKSELDAQNKPVVFTNAVYLVYDGFLPGEVVPPVRELVWKDTGQPVPDVTVSLGTPKYEGGFANKDTGQRIVFPCHVTFASDAAFNAVPNDPGFREVLLEAQMREYRTSVPLSLTRKLNPRMRHGDPHWLSIDLRAFSVKETEPPVTAGLAHPSSASEAVTYIQTLLDTYNSWKDDHPGEPHPFDALPTTQEGNELPLYSHEGTRALFNFAVARVRFHAPELVNAPDVRVFFRLWTTGWTALSYSTSEQTGSYPRSGNGAAARPLLGLYGGEINTIPCFAEAREARLTDQEDPYNIKELKGAGAEEAHAYYGCWLDINQDAKLFPLEPAPGDPGPFGGDLLTIRQIRRGLHQCLVAEIHYWPDDEIGFGDTPASSDNLAQRNLLFDAAENPGGFASHIVHHTFEMKPSSVSLTAASESAPVATTAALARLHPDEMVIDWGNLPRESLVTFFMPQVNVHDIIRFAARRQSPGNLFAVDAHTLRCRVTDVGFLPVPGPLARSIAALISVQLPPGVATGQLFHIVMRQVDGRTYRVIGTTQFNIRVKTAADILPRLVRNFSVLKHIALSIPQNNRWYPVFERYLDEMGARLRAMGEDPDSIGPSTEGGGRPEAEPHGDGAVHVGKISELIYDCYGDFEGFVLQDCDRRRRFKACEKALEEVVRRACRDRTRVTVVAHHRDQDKPHRIVLHCG
jgi:hypothetical protein